MYVGIIIIFFKEYIMDKNSKKMATGAVIVVGLIVGGYIAYLVYNNAVNDATRRIKRGVTEGVQGAMNPMNMFGGR
jgi:uncharacterized membrane protein YebE (DUF533 family)